LTTAIPSHAGGIVFRRSSGGPEYLLIRARKPASAWVFPKGHIERGETAEQAAVREVLEESGVQAKIVRGLGRLPLDTGGAEMFLMAGEPGGAPAEREHCWLTLEPAVGQLTFEESRELLRRADAIVRSLA
jgi:8-oxo-dGTP pyrophosphatase MutT (NUDIX family)